MPASTEEKNIFWFPFIKNSFSDHIEGLDPVYTGTDPNGSVPVWVQIGLPSTLDLLDPYRYGSTIRTSLGSLSKVYPFGSVPVEVQCKRLDPIKTGTDRIEHNNISHF